MSTYTQATRIVFLDLPKEVQERVDVLRNTFNPESVKRGIAHITFKQDEDYVIDDEQFIDIVESHLSTPFILTMNGISVRHENGHFVVFVAFEHHAGFHEAVATLSKELEPFIDSTAPDAFSSTRWEQSNAFFPHVTIASGKDDGRSGAELYRKVLSSGFDPRGTICCASFRICSWDHDHWKTIHHIEV